MLKNKTKIYDVWENWNPEQYQKILEQKETEYTIYIKGLDKAIFTYIFPFEYKLAWEIRRNKIGYITKAKKENICFIEQDSLLSKVSNQEFKKLLLAKPSVAGRTSTGNWAFAELVYSKRDWFKTCPNLNQDQHKSLYDLLKHAIPAGFFCHFNSAFFKKGYEIDVNSCYSYQMINKEFPIGLSLTEIKKNIPEELRKGQKGFVKFRTKSLTYIGTHFPFLATKNKDYYYQEGVKETLYILEYPQQVKGTFVVHTSLLEKIRKDYRGQIEYLLFLPFHHVSGKELFGDFVEKCQNWKNDYEKGTWQNKAGKLLPNFLYGYLGIDPWQTKTYWQVSRDEPKKVKLFWQEKNKKWFVHLAQKIFKNKKSYNYQPISICVATYALLFIIRELEKYNPKSLIAVRTDAIYLTEKPIKTFIHPSNLGSFKIKTGLITTLEEKGIIFDKEIKIFGLKEEAKKLINMSDLKEKNCQEIWIEKEQKTAKGVKKIKELRLVKCDTKNPT